MPCLPFSFSVWSANRLAQHLEKTTKIGLSDDRLRTILAEEGFSFPADSRGERELQREVKMPRD